MPKFPMPPESPLVSAIAAFLDSAQARAVLDEAETAAFTPAPTEKDPLPPYALAVSRPVTGSLPPPLRARELASLTLEDIERRIGGPASSIRFAVRSATITLAGIKAKRE